jgi:benzoyl-CoA-dihydrodiol lyase
MTFNRGKRTAELTVHAPAGPQPSNPQEILTAGDQFWPLRAFRELDDALLRLRVNEPEIGTVLIRTEGDRDAVLAIDRTLVEHQSHWLVREIFLFMKRTLKRMDLTARTFFALIEPGSAFAGSLFELALAADRSYMLHDDNEENVIALSPMNGGPPMSNGRRCRRASCTTRRRSTTSSRTRGHSTLRRRRRRGSSPSRRTRSTGTMRSASPSKRVPRSRRTR